MVQCSTDRRPDSTNHGCAIYAGLGATQSPIAGRKGAARRFAISDVDPECGLCRHWLDTRARTIGQEDNCIHSGEISYGCGWI